ncbi:MAG: efflux RND transporter periplasmic adaptor subunit [Gammaproteobacteria bacterium]|nr:efflux RND transporter periplasmic adaptor subunit [Gammaproteobacteria bacterium]
MNFKKTNALLMLALLSLTPVTMPNAADKPDAAKKERPVLAVKTITPSVESWSETQLASGGIWPWQEAIVAAETTGLRVTDILVDVGDEVKRGQKMALLASDMVRADLAQKEALVAQANAEMREAEENAKRAEEAKLSGVYSEQMVTQYLVARDKARANLSSAEAQLQSQKIRLRQTEIVAVDDGVVSARSAMLGAVPQVGAELFRLVRKNRLEWRAELMAEQVAKVKPGQDARLRLSSGEQIEGKVRMKSPVADVSSRKTLVYVDLLSSKNARAGMFAQGEILFEKKQVMTVPESAVVLRDGYSYIFEVGSDQRVIQRKVTTGQRSNNRVEVVKGLSANARIVLSGGAFLNGGDAVQVSENAAAPKVVKQ